MAAITMTSSEGTRRVACAASAGNLQLVTLPAGSIAVLLYSVAAAGKVTHTGDDAAAIGTAYATLPATTWVTVPLSNRAAWAPSGGAPSIRLAHTDNNGVIEVVPVFG